MKLIYIDEAGTSLKEPISVVVGLLVTGDSQWRTAEKAIQDTIDEYVPAELRKGFVAHATDIVGGGKYRGKWSMVDRMCFVRKLASIPFLLGIPICYCAVRRHKLGENNYKILKHGLGLKRDHDVDHVFAYYHCIAQADRLIRDHGSIEETGVVISENVSHVAKPLKGALMHLREKKLIVPNDLRDKITNPQNAEIFAERIIDCPHFAEKNEAPLLQLADTCAFVLRRWASGLSFGEELIISMLGAEPHMDGFNNEWVMGAWAIDEDARKIFEIMSNANIALYRDSPNENPGLLRSVG